MCTADHSQATSTKNTSSPGPITTGFFHIHYKPLAFKAEIKKIGIDIYACEDILGDFLSFFILYGRTFMIEKGFEFLQSAWSNRFQNVQLAKEGMAQYSIKANCEEKKVT